MLLALLAQILPFDCNAPLTAAGAGKGGIAACFRALPVCGDDGGPGGPLADHAWLPAPPAPVADIVLEGGAPPHPFVFLPQLAARRLLRPPRA